MTKVAQPGEQDVQQVIAHLTRAWNRHDAEALSQVFAGDAEMTNVLGQKFCGRQTIEQQHAFIFSNRFKQSCLKPEASRVRVLQDNLAAVDVGWQMTGSLDLRGNPWPNRKGLMNFILKNEDGAWRILLMHSVDLTASPGKPKAGQRLLRFFSSGFDFFEARRDEVSTLSDGEKQDLRAKVSEWISFKGGFVL